MAAVSYGAALGWLAAAEDAVRDFNRTCAHLRVGFNYCAARDHSPGLVCEFAALTGGAGGRSLHYTLRFDVSLRTGRIALRVDGPSGQPKHRELGNMDSLSPDAIGNALDDFTVAWLAEQRAREVESPQVGVVGFARGETGMARGAAGRGGAGRGAGRGGGRAV